MRKAGLLDFGHIDLDHILRECRVEVGVCHLNCRIGVKSGNKLLVDTEEFIEVAAGAILKFDFKAVCRGVSGDHRRLEEHDIRILDVAAHHEEPSQNCRGALSFFISLIPGFELDDE